MAWSQQTDRRHGHNVPDLLKPPKELCRAYDTNPSARETMAEGSHRPVLPQGQNVHHCRGLLFEILQVRTENTINT